jgi:hypothetical protein
MGQVLGNDTQRVKEGPLRIHKRETVLRLIGIVLQRIPLEAYAFIWHFYLIFLWLPRVPSSG